MTVLDILASTEIHSLARGCAFSYRLSHSNIMGLWGGRIIKIVNTSAIHLLLKRGGGLHSKGAYFRVSTVIQYFYHIYETQWILPAFFRKEPVEADWTDGWVE